MLDSMTALQLNEWMAYAQIEPFGEERADLRMAIEATFIGNVIYSVWTGKTGPFDKETIDALMPKFEMKEPISKEEAIAAIDAAMTSLVIATGGKDLRTTPKMDKHNLGGEDI